MKIMVREIISTSITITPMALAWGLLAMDSAAAGYSMTTYHSPP